MSTYYSLYCQACQERTDLVSDSLGGWSFMSEAKPIGSFIDRHAGHLDKLTVLIEADDRYYQAKKWPPE